jgi:hypothetical protein
MSTQMTETKKLKVYLLTKNVNRGYGKYKSFVVVSENEDLAKLVPYRMDKIIEKWTTDKMTDLWLEYKNIDKVKVAYIADLPIDTKFKEGNIICYSKQ